MAISGATRRNWSRLGVFETGAKLTKRANKTNSRKIVFPAEYAVNRESTVIAEKIAQIYNTGGYDVNDVMYSLAVSYLNTVGLKNKNTKRFTEEYADYNLIPEFSAFSLPKNEADILGFVYQSLLTEGERNKQGLYYTPMRIVKSIVGGLGFNGGESFFDPCCGSGIFFLGIDNAEPSRLYGIDVDKTAVMLCKANLIVKYRDSDVYPNIFCADYLEDFKIDGGKKFDYICTNPPWGASANKRESFACFTEKALHDLKPNGALNFLLPESVLNVKVHGDLRELLLKNYSIDEINVFPNVFSGVTTGFVSMRISNRKSKGKIKFINAGSKSDIDVQLPLKAPNFVIGRISDADRAVLERVDSVGEFTLSKSRFALGIVTGNNAEKLLDAPSDKSEPIYTGKEIRAYKLLSAKKHIEYIRERFQQVAPDEIYRAKEKLVYKFISDKLVFAYDDTRSLFLNSANILIPQVPLLSIKSVMLFLNSELFQFVHKKKFGEIKVLKGNLCELMFPRLSAELDAQCREIADGIISGKSGIDTAQDFVYGFYNISDAQKTYIKEVLGNGKSD